MIFEKEQYVWFTFTYKISPLYNITASDVSQDNRIAGRIVGVDFGACISDELVSYHIVPEDNSNCVVRRYGGEIVPMSIDELVIWKLEK